MFRHFLQKLIDRKNNQVVVIGEKHAKGSVASALSYEIKNIQKEQKKIIFLTESLSRLQSEGKDIPYSVRDLKSYDLDKVGLNEKKSLISLANQGVIVYGLESKITAVTNYFVSTDKLSLYKEIKKDYSYFLEDPLQKEKIETLLKDNDISFDIFSILIESMYGARDERITIPNKEFSQELIQIIDGKENVLCILGVGAAHIPQATRLKTKEILDEGIQAKLQREFADKKTDVTACFVSFAHDTVDGGTYTPENDEKCLYGQIGLSFKMPIVDPDEEYIVKIESRLNELKQTSRWNVFKLWHQSDEVKLLTEVCNLYRTQKKPDFVSLKEIVAEVQNRYEKVYQSKISLQTKELLNQINPPHSAFSKQKLLSNR